MLSLTNEELVLRANRIKLVLSDNDGVFTDNGVYYGANGEVMKRYSIRDGMGVERLQGYGIDTAIMTGERSASIAMRAEKLKMKHLYLGASDKLSKLDDVLSDTGLSLHELAYIGDDVNDAAIMKEIAAVGLTACPNDALDFVRPFTHYTALHNGGYGAFRDFAEWLISLKILARA
ncbi:KdsC family phosphatase [Chlorobium phaeobacteroides]|jgi:3-deoxy-D-manno-octulosonate 8-phosphate phosphatase (KDO 8-P phosphatase)|uniref:3-deoxy-D-manno-octulosonate 8-phosphate phosphatase, YrbI family n=1 Tax=Chlorobium phaeobacteroides (strain DSM 266 / SMG 266 / 2430) TaxID=290317 RepID=A1BFP5_CHLPD|nr:3-deoxy-D-manno-octulosonate 8-phosphate phosphatase [Chlorobium phaeobacteroides]ABL65222.1 3-deoxy-D-manno-octulosonate 8-phosphate phosphatase, YrbI family [Chlorobium phaeobacteroides DSM 266]MBV5327629.1 3-deoxy-D-manno-octulosonate 8-phosphate phosphatase [Chlorobium sp.]